MPKTNISSKKLENVINDYKTRLQNARTMGYQVSILDDIRKDEKYSEEIKNEIFNKLRPTMDSNMNRFISNHTTGPDTFGHEAPKGGRKRKTRSNKKSTKKGKKAKKSKKIRKTKKNR